MYASVSTAPSTDTPSNSHRHARDAEHRVIRIEVIDVLACNDLMAGKDRRRHRLLRQNVERQANQPRAITLGKESHRCHERSPALAQLDTRIGFGILPHDRAIQLTAGLLE